MWVFTQDGFYSAVADRKDPSQLVVRARAKRDIVALCARIEGARWHRTPPPADYGWRAFVPREAFATYVAQEAFDIDYDNFKHMVHDRLGARRATIYTSIWARLLELQPLPKVRPPRWWGRGPAQPVEQPWDDLELPF